MKLSCRKIPGFIPRLFAVLAIASACDQPTAIAERDPQLATVASAAPSDFDAAALSTTQIGLSWTIPPAFDGTFVLHRRAWDGTTWDSYRLLARPGANDSSYIDSAVAANSVYQYRLRACDVTGCSEWVRSKAVHASLVPAAPSTVAATVLGATHVQVTWSDWSTSESGFEVWRRVNSDDAWSPWTFMTRLGTDVTEYNDDMSIGDAIVQYRVRACNGAGCSSFAVSNRTAAPVGACPSITAFGAIPDDGLNDTWAIQRALRNAKRCAVVPAGVFDVGRPLRIEDPGFSLRGEGEGSVLKFDNSIDFREHYPGRTGIITILASDVTISGLTIDQNFRSTGLQDGVDPFVASISIGEADYRTFENIAIRSCIFHDYYGDAINGRDVWVRNARVLNNTFRSAYAVGNWTVAYGRGEQAVAFDLGSDITVSDNRIEAALDDAIAFHLDTRNVVVSRNTITTTGGRILMNGVTTGVVTDNVITYIQDGVSAIQIGREPTIERIAAQPYARISRNVLVTHNTVSVRAGVIAGGGLVAVYGGESIEVSDNILSREEPHGLGIRLVNRESSAGVIGNVGVLLKNNVITRVRAGVAVHLHDQTINRDITITGNTFMECDVGVIDKLGAPYVQQFDNTDGCAQASMRVDAVGKEFY